MERITIHVPELLPDGSRVPANVLAAFEQQLCELASDARLMSAGANEEGFTILTGATGAWRSNEGMYREPLRLYFVDVADAESGLEVARTIADSLRVALDQQAVYLTVSPIDALLVMGTVAV